MEGTVDFEPFMKNGFKLLRRTKDTNSIKQMFKHFEEAIQEQYGGARRPTNAAKKLAIPTTLLSKELGIEQAEMIGDDESSSSSSSSSPLPNMSKSIVEVCSSPPPTITLEQAQSDPVINIDSDSDLETDNLSYSCCVCKDGSVILGNSLVECLECHSMYHQNCHSPPITDINLNDPRIVWYCISCKQKDSQKTESRVSGKESKKSSSKSTSGSKQEKSSSSKTSQSAKGSSSKSKSSSANSSPKHYLHPSSNHPPVMSVVEKRVQMMKKKAAKKSEKKK